MVLFYLVYYLETNNKSTLVHDGGDNAHTTLHNSEYLLIIAMSLLNEANSTLLNICATFFICKINVVSLKWITFTQRCPISANVNNAFLSYSTNKTVARKKGISHLFQD